MNINGTFTMTFPDKGPGSFLLQGTASIFFFSFATMALEYQTDGYAQFRAAMDASLGPLAWMPRRKASSTDRAASSGRT